MWDENLEYKNLDRANLEQKDYLNYSSLELNL